MEIENGKFYLGGLIDPASGERTNENLLYDSASLTTHGVIVGMTGSGKTGLAVALLEEALLQGVPCLIIDPKGDMTNLLLNFPEFRAEDFRPWIDDAAARREGLTPDELAAKTADSWKEGLASWGIGPERLRALGTGAQFTIYTPGSTSGVPLNVVGSMAPPDLPWESEAETLRAEIEGIVSSLLVLAGITADPVSSPEHILLANIVENAWRSGEALDLAGLIGRIQKPPFRKMGVFELDAFFPPKDRTALAMKLNALVASPSFAAWLEGKPLDVATMLDQPRAAIVYLAHLSDTERQFVVTLLLSKVVTWFRKRSGTSNLAALIYMDEVFGFCPPTAEPPSKKPILTIFKQARAFGVGIVLATQNPVDLDYKVMSNAGSWMVGRLQTERDKARIIEGISTAAGGVDVAYFDKLISGLAKRQFLLHQAKENKPIVFGSRWAMSYLAGPLTKDQVGKLTHDGDTTAPTGKPTTTDASTEPGPTAGTTSAVAPDDAVPVAPSAAVDVKYLDPAATWSDQVGASAGASQLQAAVATTVHLRYDDDSAGIDHLEDWEAIIYPLTDQFSPDSVITVDHDPRDFETDVPTVAGYVLPNAPIGQVSYFKAMQTSLIDWLVRSKSVEVWRNGALKLYSRVGETEADFTQRCVAASAEKADAEMAELKDRFATRIERVEDQVSAAENRVNELEVDVSSRRQQEVVGGAGDLLGALLGGRRSSAGLGRAATRRRQTRVSQERLATAQERAAVKTADLEELESDLADEIAAIADKWEDVAAALEQIKVPLEKTDVTVEPLVLVWIPR